MRQFDKEEAAEILVAHANIDMTRRHIACLHSLTWLNDEVINMYMALLQVCVCIFVTRQPLIQQLTTRSP